MKAAEGACNVVNDDRHNRFDLLRDVDRSAELRAAMNTVIHGQLCPLSIGLACLYVIFACAHPFTLPPEIAKSMSLTAAATAVSAGLLWTYVRRIAPSSNHVQWVTVALTLLALTNSLLHLYVTGEPRQSTNILLIVVAAGYLILSTQLFAGVLVLSLAAWVATAVVLPGSDVWVHYGFAVFQATLISIVIHMLRVRTTKRAEWLRLREVWRGDALEEAKERAEEMALLKSTFLANMSHEIRTPLTGILGFAEIMEEEAGESMKQLARTITRNGHRLLDTLNSVLDLARLEADKMTMDVEIVILGDAVAPVIELFRPLAAKRGLSLNVVVNDPDAAVAIDPSWLLRIQNNLVGNAVKFTETGGITVSVTASATEVHLTIQDTGIGIEDDYLPYLFEEFRQASTGLARAHEGSGLGLAITHRLVDMAGGVITVESRPGYGSTFNVTFPRAHPGDRPADNSRTGKIAAPATV